MQTSGDRVERLHRRFDAKAILRSCGRTGISRGSHYLAINRQKVVAQFRRGDRGPLRATQPLELDPIILNHLLVTPAKGESGDPGPQLPPLSPGFPLSREWRFNRLESALVPRVMIDFSLRNNRSNRYRHAARHLLDCSSLALAIKDLGIFEPHDAYEARLRREHARKSSFWSLID